MIDSRRPVHLGLVWKLLLAFAAVILVALAAVAVLANQAAAREVRGFMFRGGMSDSNLLASELAAYYRGRGSWEGVDVFLGSTAQRWEGRGGMMHGAPGEGAAGMAGMMVPVFVLADSRGRVIAGPGTPEGASLTEEQVGAGTTIRLGDDVVGILYVAGESQIAVGADLIARVNRVIILAALASGGVALLLAGVLSVGLLRPVRELTSAAQGLAGGNLSRRVDVRNRDELGQLSAAFNQMADSLERAEKLRRDMTADIAHELRNPLAILQARLEGILDGVYPPSPENLELILDQNRVLTRLVEDLRTLALADAGQLSLDRVPCDLSALIRRSLDSLRSQAQESGIRMTSDAQPLTLLADPIRIEQVLGNLLSNALRHTPQGGEVVVGCRLAPGGQTVVVEVGDSGEGIAQEALPMVFERFYRGDRSRSRSEGGTGLGLAIARKLVEAHGGTIHAGNRPQGGALFTIELPIENKGQVSQSG